MIDVITAIAIVLMAGFGVTVALWARSGACPPMSRPVTRSFWCPLLGRNVTAEFEEEVVWDRLTLSTEGWGGRRVAVERCTAFSPPSAIVCERACLGHGTLEPVRDGGQAA